MDGFLIIFTLFLSVSFLLSEIFCKLRYPRVVGLIFAGIVLGFFGGVIFREGSFPAALEGENPMALAISGLSDLGAIFLLILVGLELDLGKMKKVSKDVFAIGLFGSVIPFLLGFFVMKMFFDATDIVAFIVGACLAISAEATTSMTLMEEGRLRSKVGEVMLGAGAIDDVLGVLFLSIVIIFAQGEQPSTLASILINNVSVLEGINESTGGLFQILLLPVDFLVFVIFSSLLFKIIPQLVEYTKRERSATAEFMTVIILGLTIAIISEFLGLGTIVGALAAGIIMQVAIEDRKEEHRIVNTLKVVSLSLIVPFFFISVGLHFNIASIFEAPTLLAAILGVAVIGKFLGSILAKPFTDLSMKQHYLIGWGMNSRGAVELVIASVALPILVAEKGVEYATDVFTVIISMAILTTVIFPFFLKREIAKNPRIMN